jgi:plasmid maintenance system antidote protein VapI
MQAAVDPNHGSSYATLMTPQQYLQNYLKSKGITQAEFGKSLDVRQEMVNQWLTSRRPISPEKALLIEKLYGLDAEILCPRLRRLRKTAKV